MPSPTHPHRPPEWYTFHLIPAAEATLSNLTLASRTATTLSVTWSAGYPMLCYSFTLSHFTQDGSINVTQPADSDTSHTLTSLQPGTTYRIEVEAVRKRDGADIQRAKVVGFYTTDGPSAYALRKLFDEETCVHYNHSNRNQRLIDVLTIFHNGYGVEHPVTDGCKCLTVCWRVCA